MIPRIAAPRSAMYRSRHGARLDRDAQRVDLRLVARGHVHQRRDFTFGHTRHVWAPSAGFIIPDRMQDRDRRKEVGLVEYRFQPDSFEVRHVRAAGQIDVGLDELLKAKSKS